MNLSKRATTLHKSMNSALLLGVTAALLSLSVSPLAMSQSNVAAFVDLSDLDGSDGFVINGVGSGDNSGYSVSGAGDINGDGLDDLLIGAPNADPNGVVDAGQSYVLFGGGTVGDTGLVELSLLDGSNGFAINGIDQNDAAGWSVSDAGDIN